MADLEDLDRLAPDVDADTALEEFRRRRTGRSLPRWPLLVAAGVLGVVGIVGATVLASDDDEPVATGPGSESPNDVEFEVLSVAEAVVPMGTLDAVTDADRAPEFWDLSGAESPYPEVDLTTTVLVAITIPDDACPPDLRRFERDGEQITPVFVETAAACEEPLIPKTYVAVLPRAQFGGAIELHLPADETYGIDEQRLSVSLGRATGSTVTAPSGPVPPPTCADIENFADQLVDVGISYDYSASESPEDAAESAELVLSGRLTGGFTSEPTMDRVGYEIDIDELHKSPPGAELVDPITIYVDIGAVDPADFAAAIVADIPVVVMAEWLDRAGGERPFAGIEGFVTGCPGGPLLGFTGSQGAWTDVVDLDDLATRLGSE